jgi:hypothetical protein
VSAGVQVNQSDLIADLIDVWNNAFFYARDIGVSIVEDEAISSSPPGTGGTKYTLYLNCAPAEQPVRGPGYFESNRLSPITERTEPSLAGNRSLERPSGIFIPELT